MTILSATAPRPIDEYVRSASLHRLVDGDTLALKIDLGYEVGLVSSLRLVGVNTPEIVGAAKPLGKASAAFVQQWFASHGEVLVRSYKAKQKEKYGRWLIEVWSADGTGLSLNQELLARGLAVPMGYP